MNNSDSDEVLSTINYEGKHCLCQVDLQTAKHISDVILQNLD
jgi:hypothetical protein